MNKKERNPIKDDEWIGLYNKKFNDVMGVWRCISNRDAANWLNKSEATIRNWRFNRIKMSEAYYCLFMNILYQYDKDCSNKKQQMLEEDRYEKKI